ncbi:MAG: hypothetical protein OYL92_14510 [Acidobacteriota bacterium]|nr:hypothetical protein [Acidobacteriota bacterium]MDE2922996.1 hypothetical protein [Acidobacteriota bacterium]MDE3266175.1 hypothetical protein [Acidobacteriota bacterium]
MKNHLLAAIANTSVADSTLQEAVGGVNIACLNTALSQMLVCLGPSECFYYVNYALLAVCLL